MASGRVLVLDEIEAIREGSLRRARATLGVSPSGSPICAHSSG